MEDTDDVYKLSKMTDILHALFITYKTDFFQYFDLIVHQFAKLLVSFHIINYINRIKKKKHLIINY